jgi:hypothetical protein
MSGARRSLALPPRALLSRVLDQPKLIQAVQSLPPATLGSLVRHVGLEDAGELIALASPDQLVRVLDDDVWAAAGGGRDESFDAERFGLWLEVLREVGEEVAAEKLLSLPEELVTLGLHELVLVVDLDELGVEMAEIDEADADLIEKALDASLCEELDQYRVIARHAQSWDAVIGVLLTLDRDHHSFVARLLERLAHASSEVIEDHGGLYEALTSGEMLGEDAAADRESRRAAEGYLASSQAGAFLALARSGSVADTLKEKGRDAVTKAYFRELDRGRTEPRPDAGVQPLLKLLRESGVDVPAAPQLSAKTPRDTEPAFQRAVREIAEHDPALHAERMDELSFLVNVLLSDARARGRSLRPIEAARAVTAICSLGLEAAAAPDAAARVGAERLFRIGLRVLEVEAPAKKSAAFQAAERAWSAVMAGNIPR